MDAELPEIAMSEAVFRVAKEFDVVKVKLTKEGRERVDRLLPNRQCLGCEVKVDKGQRYTCGNCGTCYNAVLEKSTAVRADLMRDGKTLPPTKGGRKPANKFTRELAEL